MKTTRTTKKSLRAAIKTLDQQIGAIRATWQTRGVAEGEYDQVRALETQRDALENQLDPNPMPRIDPMFL
jgi:hypothetical protein